MVRQQKYPADFSVSTGSNGGRGFYIAIIAALAVVIVLFSAGYTLLDQQIRSERHRLDEIEGQAARIEKLSSKLSETRQIIQQLVVQLNESHTDDDGRAREGVRIRRKRGSDDQYLSSDDQQAEDDLSQLSLTGLSFLRGPVGYPGRDGRDGPAGAPGVQGPAGAPGLRGDKGEPGERGLPGVNGNNGQAGRDGLPGRQGNLGPPGASGSDGSPGTTGSSGPSGLPGRPGERGLPGQPGTQGQPGVQGPPGSAGLATENGGGVNVTALEGISSEVSTLKDDVRALKQFEIDLGTTSLRCPDWSRAQDYSSVLIEESCYILVENKLTWSRAKSYCESKGYDLVSFETSTKQSLVEEWLISSLGRTQDDDVWTSGYRRQGDPLSDWYWNKNNLEIAISDYVDWRSGEPQAHEYCLASEYLSWYGRACTDRYDFVCEGPPVRERIQPQASGAVYTHWGRRACSNSSHTIYSGLVGGASYEATGGGVDFQCLPSNPDIVNFNPLATSVSWMRSIEYESQNYGLFPDGIDDKHAVCARCFTASRSAVMMIPAKLTCPEDWVTEYSGYLMASLESAAHPTNYVCVDSDPEYFALPSANGGGRWYFVNVDCQGPGSVGQCNYYRNKSQMSCVVCSR